MPVSTSGTQRATTNPSCARLLVPCQCRDPSRCGLPASRTISWAHRSWAPRAMSSWRAQRLDGALAGIACRAEHSAFVNGHEMRVGYIGQIRIAPDFRGRWLIHRGAQRMRELSPPGPLVLRRDRPRKPTRPRRAHRRPLAGGMACRAPVWSDDLRDPFAPMADATQRRPRSAAGFARDTARGRGLPATTRSPPPALPRLHTRGFHGRHATARFGAAGRYGRSTFWRHRWRDGHLGPDGVQAGRRRRIRIDAATPPAGL